MKKHPSIAFLCETTPKIPTYYYFFTTFAPEEG